jgi:hypothetical protein
VSDITEIQDAIAKLQPKEKSALAAWLQSQEEPIMSEAEEKALLASLDRAAAELDAGKVIRSSTSARTSTNGLESRRARETREPDEAGWQPDWFFGLVSVEHLMCLSCLTWLFLFFCGLAAHKDALLAFVALVGPIITTAAIVVGVRTANKQLRVNILSANSHKWVVEFREDVAKVLGILSSIHLPGTNPASAERHNLITKLQYHRAKTRLLIREKSDIEGALSILIGRAIQAVERITEKPLSQRDYSELDQITFDIIQLSQTIIMEEEKRLMELV